MKRKFLVHTATLISGVVEVNIDEEAIYRGEFGTAAFVQCHDGGPKTSCSSMVIANEEEGKVSDAQRMTLNRIAATHLIGEVMRAVKAEDMEMIKAVEVHLSNGMKH